jgi:hypothetical protein
MTRARGRTIHAVLLAVAVGAISIPVGAGIAIRWQKDEVIPVVLVKPGIGGFVPSEGSSIGNTWPKSQVKPVLLVKPGIGGFEPREGLSIGNTWTKGDVLPVMLVEPAADGFVSLHLLDSQPAAEPGVRQRLGGPRRPFQLVDSQPAAEPDSESGGPRTEPQDDGGMKPLEQQDESTNAESEMEALERKLAETMARIAPAGDGPAFIETRIAGEFEGWEGETIFMMENAQIWQQASYAYTYHYAYRPEVYRRCPACS